MLYDYPPRKQAEEDIRFKLLVHSAMTPNTGFAAASPLVMEEIIREVSKLRIGQRLRSAIKWMLGQRRNPIATPPVNENLADRFGVIVPLGDQDSKELLEEVRKFKWLEAERAGRDIWRERNPRDPEAAAFREWFARHYGAWHLARAKRFEAA